MTKPRSSSTHVWTEVLDPATGRHYYYNPVTKEVSWTHPSTLKKSRLSGLTQEQMHQTANSLSGGGGDGQAVTTGENDNISAAEAAMEREAGDVMEKESESESEPVVVLVANSEAEADRVYASTVQSHDGEIQVHGGGNDMEKEKPQEGENNSEEEEEEKENTAATGNENDGENEDESESGTDDDDDEEEDDDDDDTASDVMSAITPSTPTGGAASSSNNVISTAVATTSAEAEEEVTAVLQQKKSEKKKKTAAKEKKAVQIFEQVRALMRKHPPEEGKTLGDMSVKDKFLIVHLHTVEDEEGYKYQGFSNAPDTKSMETELKGYLHLRSAFRGDLADVITALDHTYNECINIILPTSRLNMVHLAVASGHANLVKHLCDQFPHLVDSTALNGLTPLMIACVFGVHEIIQVLAERGADLNAMCTSVPYARAGTPFRIAAQYWSNTIFKGLKSLGQMTPLLYAIFSGCPRSIQMLYQLDPKGLVPQQSKVNLAKYTSDPLTLAIVQQASKPTIQYLISEHKMDPNFKDINGVTPLILASMCHGNGNICSLLISYDVNINQVDSRNGNTSLHYAIFGGHRSFIKHLCHAKKGTEELAVNINHNNPKQQFTPLQLAKKVPNLSDETRKKVISMLKKYGAMERRLYSEVLKEGYLTKEGHVVKNWKTRWFVLKQDTLIYYKNLQKLKQARGNIKIPGALIQDHPHKRKNCFSVHDVHNDKTFYLCAPSEREKQEWIDACQFAIRTSAMDTEEQTGTSE